MIEVEYKGQTLRLVPEDKRSLVSRLVKRKAIVGTLDDREAAQRELDAEMRASWESKWNEEGRL